MTSLVVSQQVQAFERGEVASSLRSVQCAGKTPQDLHRQLVALGFSPTRYAVPGPCDRNGKPRWWMRDGSAATDEKSANAVPEDVYVHRDRGVVSVFPCGRPWLIEPLNRPVAMKYVILRPPAATRDPMSGRTALVSDTSLRNRVMRVTESGRGVPRSLRHADGLRNDSLRGGRGLALEVDLGVWSQLSPGPEPKLAIERGGPATGTFTIVPAGDFWQCVPRITGRATEPEEHSGIKLVRDKTATHLFFPGRGLLTHGLEDGTDYTRVLCSLRLMLGSYVLQVDPSGYEGSVVHLCDFVKWILDELKPCRVFEDGTGRDFSRTAPRFPNDLFRALPLVDPP